MFEQYPEHSNPLPWLDMRVFRDCTHKPSRHKSFTDNASSQYKTPAKNYQQL